jgi:hypothetical protein
MTATTVTILIACLLAEASVSGQESTTKPDLEAAARGRTVQLNGGLEATFIKMGRSKNHEYLTVSLRISNKGRNTAYLLLVNSEATGTTATDNTGGIFNRLDTVGGIAYCYTGVNRPSYCLGIPEKGAATVPIQNFTQLDPNPDPNAAITVNLGLRGQSTGPLLSFSASMYVRFGDPLQDAKLSDTEFYKQFRTMTLSFPSMTVTDAP